MWQEKEQKGKTQKVGDASGEKKLLEKTKKKKRNVKKKMVNNRRRKVQWKMRLKIMKMH